MPQGRLSEKLFICAVIIGTIRMSATAALIAAIFLGNN
jgi:hypothetical protein